MLFTTNFALSPCLFCFACYIFKDNSFSLPANTQINFEWFCRCHPLPPNSCFLQREFFFLFFFKKFLSSLLLRIEAPKHKGCLRNNPICFSYCYFVFFGYFLGYFFWYLDILFNQLADFLKEREGLVQSVCRFINLSKTYCFR